MSTFEQIFPWNNSQTLPDFFVLDRIVNYFAIGIGSTTDKVVEFRFCLHSVGFTNPFFRASIPYISFCPSKQNKVQCLNRCGWVTAAKHTLLCFSLPPHGHWVLTLRWQEGKQTFWLSTEALLFLKSCVSAGTIQKEARIRIAFWRYEGIFSSLCFAFSSLQYTYDASYPESSHSNLDWK